VVTGVVAGSAADGLLQSADVIVRMDDTPITRTDDLFTALQAHVPGDVVTFTVDRTGGQLRVPLTLGSSADNPPEPRIGTNVVTRFLETPPSALIDGTVSGPYTRLVDINGAIYRLDPITGEFASTGVLTPQGTWHAAGDRVFQGFTTDGSIRALDGTSLSLPGAVAQGVIGSIDGDLLVVGANPVDASASLSRIDPVSFLIGWSARLATVDTAPVAAFPAPGSQKILVARPSGADAFRYEVWDAALGTRVDTPKLESATFDAVFGWYDTHLIVGQIGGSVSTFDPITGDQQALDMPFAVRSGDELYPVGDGDHIVQVAGRDMTLATLGGGESRQLIVNCAIGTVDVAGSNL
jgi:hypothetical protein